MKKIILIVLVLISIKGISQSKTIETNTIYFEVNDAKNRIVLCGKIQHIDDLRTLVEKLYKEKSITLAGKTIIWRKGYPVWGPYSSHGPGYRTQKLFFGYVTKIIGNVFYVEGNEKNTNFHYPYILK